MPYSVIWRRLRDKWAVKEAVETPLNKPWRHGSKRRIYRCTYKGEIMGVAELSQAIGIKKDTIYHRIVRGASLQGIADDPHPSASRKHFIFGGCEYTSDEAAELAGITRETFLDRIKAGESVESIILTGNRRVKKYPYKGKHLTLRELFQLSECQLKDIRVLKARICGYGWPIERAVTTPARKKNKKYLYQGKQFSLSELAKLPECIVGIKVLQSRLHKCWPVEKALTKPIDKQKSRKT